MNMIMTTHPPHAHHTPSVLALPLRRLDPAWTGVEQTLLLSVACDEAMWCQDAHITTKRYIISDGPISS